MENSIVCKKCKILKPLTKEFFKTTFNKKYQKEYLEKTCKSCRHKKQVKRARERYHSDSEFDSHQDEQFRKCWALSNLQPKWETANLKKGNRFIG